MRDKILQVKLSWTTEEFELFSKYDSLLDFETCEYMKNVLQYNSHAISLKRVYETKVSRANTEVCFIFRLFI